MRKRSKPWRAPSTSAFRRIEATDYRFERRAGAGIVNRDLGQCGLDRGNRRRIAVGFQAQCGILGIERQAPRQGFENPRVADAQCGQNERDVARVFSIEFAQQFEQRLDRGLAQFHDGLHQIVRHVAHIVPDRAYEKRKGGRRMERVEQIDQQRLQIHQVGIVILGGEMDEIGQRLLRRLENRVQQPLIDRDIAVPGSLEQRIRRDAFVASRVENEFRMRQETTLLLLRR